MAISLFSFYFFGLNEEGEVLMCNYHFPFCYSQTLTGVLSFAGHALHLIVAGY